MDDKDEKPINGIETQTSKDEDEPKTRWEKICRKFRINPNLVMLKLTLFFMYGGEYDKFEFYYRVHERDFFSIGVHFYPSSNIVTSTLSDGWFTYVTQSSHALQRIFIFITNRSTCKASASPWKKLRSFISHFPSPRFLHRPSLAFWSTSLANISPS